MITTINEFMINETYSKLEFENIHLDYHNQQNCYKMNAKLNGEIVAYCDYTEYNGIYQISMIESLVKGQGYGKAIMMELARLYGYKNIERNNLTPDGQKLRNKVDNELGFDYTEYKKSLNKHLSNEESIDKIRIKYPLCADFMSEIILFDYSDTWLKWKNNNKIKNIEQELQNTDIDINDLSDITEWIKNSATNNNSTTESVPDYILEYIQKLS